MCTAARKTCGHPLPKRGQNTILRLYPGLSWPRPVPACLSGRVPFESMTSGNIPLAGVRLPPSLTVPQPERMMSWENRFRGSFLNPRILSSAFFGTGPVHTAAPSVPEGLCPPPFHVPSERREGLTSERGTPSGRVGPESRLCLHTFSGYEHLLGADQALSAHCLAPRQLQGQPSHCVLTLAWETGSFMGSTAWAWFWKRPKCYLLLLGDVLA